MLGWAVLPIYGVAIVLCARAAFAARHWRAPGSDRLFWSLVTMFFALLVVSRVTGFEDLVRASMKAALDSGGRYSARRPIQAAIAVGAAAMGAVVAYFSWRKLLDGKPRPIASALSLALAGSWAMAGLVVMRLISLHQIDRLLYSGPHLNRFADPAAAIVVCAGAWSYVLRVRRLATRRV